MASRKTIKVEYVKERANDMLLKSADHLAEGRKAVTHLLESTLHDTGNYRGFRYLTPNDMKDVQGSTVGINEVDFSADPTMEEKFDGTDSTRVEYF